MDNIDKNVKLVFYVIKEEEYDTYKNKIKASYSDDKTLYKNWIMFNYKADAIFLL